jgi:hypothetical protein
VSSLEDLFGPVIHSYTRADAIRDGQLIDVSEVAREAGFRIPVAMTLGAHLDCVAWTEEDERRKPQFTGQDEAGRLWDVATMARMQLNALSKAGPLKEGRHRFQLYRVPREGRGVQPRKVTLVVHLGGGDAGEPVATVMREDED